MFSTEGKRFEAIMFIIFEENRIRACFEFLLIISIYLSNIDMSMLNSSYW